MLTGCGQPKGQGLIWRLKWQITCFKVHTGGCGRDPVLPGHRAEGLQQLVVRCLPQLPAMWPGPLIMQLSIWQPASIRTRKQQKGVHKIEASSSMSPHFTSDPLYSFHVPCVRNESLQGSFEGKSPHKDMNTRRWGSLRAILKLCHRKCEKPNSSQQASNSFFPSFNKCLATTLYQALYKGPENILKNRDMPFLSGSW